MLQKDILSEKLGWQEWERARRHFNPTNSRLRDFTMSYIALQYESYRVFMYAKNGDVFLREAERIAKGRRLCDFLTFIKAVCEN